jgi:hypothetical protein
MEAAMHALENAKVELESAEHDKGGWRARALKHVEEAMKETRKGMAYAVK